MSTHTENASAGVAQGSERSRIFSVYVYTSDISSMVNTTIATCADDTAQKAYKEIAPNF